MHVIREKNKSNGLSLRWMFNMRVIVVASRKGGCGKSTLAAHLSVQAHRQGSGPVALVDLDPQGSLSDWLNGRKSAWPAFCDVGRGGGLARTLEALRAEKSANLVIIDTPPAAASSAIRSVLDLADLVLVPVVPSPNDLRAIGNTLGAIEDAGKPLVFVLNIATSPRMTHEASSALSQHGTVAPVIIRSRTDFRSSMTDGRVAVEINPASKSAEEIAGLWTYLNNRLIKLEQARGRTSNAA